MDPNTNYYEVLGIAPNVTSATIQAKYRALAKRYHPDVATGDKALASEKFRLIIKAYEVLGNAKSRARYDAERQRRHSGRSTRRHQSVPATEDALGPSTEAWKSACRYVPELETLRVHLAQISPSLAVAFQTTLLTSKEFDKATMVASKLKEEFLARYLDVAPELVHFRR